MTERPETPSPLPEGLTPPGAPPELRARVLAAARTALAARPVGLDRWSLLWASRPLRLAWAAAVLLLLAGHAVLVPPPRAPVAAAALPLARSVHDADAELATIGRLPRLDPDARPLGVGPADPSQPTAPPGPDRPKENRT